MHRVVVVILDGLRRDFIDADAHAEPASLRRPRDLVCGAPLGVSLGDALRLRHVRHRLPSGAARAAGQRDGAAGSRRRWCRTTPACRTSWQHKRAVTGRALAEPTLAERLAPHGGAVIFSNVSPGAAYAHDPDGFGHLHHRAGSFAPGRVPAGRLEVTLDAAGDRAMTERFIAEALAAAPEGARRPALALLWCAEPDHIQHDHPLGSPRHLAVLAEADRNAGAVIDAVDGLRPDGDEVLLIVGSDHGHETVSGLDRRRGRPDRRRPEIRPRLDRHRGAVQRHLAR